MCSGPDARPGDFEVVHRLDDHHRELIGRGRSRRRRGRRRCRPPARSSGARPALVDPRPLADDLEPPAQRPADLGAGAELVARFQRSGRPRAASPAMGLGVDGEPGRACRRGRSRSGDRCGAAAPRPVAAPPLPGQRDGLVEVSRGMTGGAARSSTACRSAQSVTDGSRGCPERRRVVGRSPTTPRAASSTRVRGRGCRGARGAGRNARGRPDEADGAMAVPRLEAGSRSGLGVRPGDLEHAWRSRRRPRGAGRGAGPARPSTCPTSSVDGLELPLPDEVGEERGQRGEPVLAGEVAVSGIRRDGVREMGRDEVVR